MTIKFNDPNQAKFDLYNGVKMPVFGFGTYKVTGQNCYNNIIKALETGYRLIDTASFYKNEEEIGRAVNDFLKSHRDVKREDIFIITKVWPDDMTSRDKCRQSVERSLQKLNMSYVDLVLLHWPGIGGKDSSDKENHKFRIECWKELEQLYNSGKVKAIGVSNFTPKHIDQLKQDGATIWPPMVNQVELHPMLPQDDLMKYCKNLESQGRKMIIQAYSVLGSDEIPVLKELQQHDIRLEQLMQWLVQDKEVGVLLRCEDENKVRQNFDAFSKACRAQELSQDVQRKFHQFASQEKRFCWNPHEVA